MVKGKQDGNCEFSVNKYINEKNKYNENKVEDFRWYFR